MIRIKLPAIDEQKIEQVFSSGIPLAFELDIAPGSCFFFLDPFVVVISDIKFFPNVFHPLERNNLYSFFETFPSRDIGNLYPIWKHTPSVRLFLYPSLSFPNTVASFFVFLPLKI